MWRFFDSNRFIRWKLFEVMLRKAHGRLTKVAVFWCDCGILVSPGKGLVYKADSEKRGVDLEFMARFSSSFFGRL